MGITWFNTIRLDGVYNGDNTNEKHDDQNLDSPKTPNITRGTIYWYRITQIRIGISNYIRSLYEM